MKILMVCLGNICRSPLAEGILKAKAAAYGLDWQVDSAGTSSWHVGELPDKRSIATARQHGIDITDQRARQLRPADLDTYDLILAMDRNNLRDILRLAQNERQRQKVRLVMEFVDPNQPSDVPDPYWDDDGFEQVYQMLEQAAEGIIAAYGAVPKT